MAPLIAAVVGLLIGLGFVIPHIGARVSQYVVARREFRALAPLARTLEHVPAASAPVSLGRTASLRLRLTHRRTFVRDALRHLHPFVDTGLHEEAVQHLLAAGKSPSGPRPSPMPQPSRPLLSACRPAAALSSDSRTSTV